MKQPNKKKYIKWLAKVSDCQDEFLYMRFQWKIGLKKALDRLMDTERLISEVEL